MARTVEIIKTKQKEKVDALESKASEIAAALSRGAGLVEMSAEHRRIFLPILRGLSIPYDTCLYGVAVAESNKKASELVDAYVNDDDGD